MSEYLIQDTTLEDIADAIRAKKGTQAGIQVSDFPSEIASIPTGGDPIIVESDSALYNDGLFSSLHTYPTFYYNNDYYVVGNGGLYKYNTSTKMFESVISWFTGGSTERGASGALVYVSSADEYIYVYWPTTNNYTRYIYWIRLSNMTRGYYDLANSGWDTSINHQTCLIKHPTNEVVYFYSGYTAANDCTGHLNISINNNTVSITPYIASQFARPSNTGDNTTRCFGCITSENAMCVIRSSYIIKLPWDSMWMAYSNPTTHAISDLSVLLNTNAISSYGTMLMKALSPTSFMFLAYLGSTIVGGKWIYKTLIITYDTANSTATFLKILSGILRSSTSFSNDNHDMCFFSGSGVYAVDTAGNITAI